MVTRIFYEVSTHRFGRPMIRNGPASGCRGFEVHRWTRITKRPISFDRAKKLADDQDLHAVVTPWQAAGAIYDNGKAPGAIED